MSTADDNNPPCVKVSLQQGGLRSEEGRAWDYLPTELLNTVKKMLEKSEARPRVIVRTMVQLRLVNRHWSSWATRATTVFRAEQDNVRLASIVEKFVNLSSLEISTCITGSGLRTLSRLSCLTQLEIIHPLYYADRGLTDKSLRYLQNVTTLRRLRLLCCTNLTNDGLRALEPLKALRDLDLTGCVRITDVGVKHLKCLTKLCMHGCGGIGSKFSNHIGYIDGLRDVDLSFCDLIDENVENLSSLTCLTKLWLRNSPQLTDTGVEYVTDLIGLREIDLHCCRGITNFGVELLTSLTNLTRLGLRACDGIRDSGLYCLVDLVSLRELDLQWCQNLTDDGISHIRSIMPLVKILSA